jgi:hypothetical protein
VDAGKKKRRASPPKASWGRYETLRRWRLLPHAERIETFRRVITRAANEPDYREQLIALLDWLVENAPRPRGREMQLTPAQMDDFGRWMRDRVVRRPNGLSITEGIEQYSADNGIDSGRLRRAWKTQPEFVYLRELQAHFDLIERPGKRASQK